MLGREITGSVFGRLTVLAVNPGSNGSRRRARCVCSCGAEVDVAVGKLRSGETKSCGCLRREVVSALRMQHGESHALGDTPEYRAWCHMKGRCNDPHDKSFRDYGGRGIRVCDRWAHSFEAFLADVGRRPSTRHSLDRKNNNGNYEPGNVRWATRTEQNSNKRSNAILEIDGERLTIAAWAKRSGLAGQTIVRRIRAGLSPRDAVSRPARSQRRCA